MTKPPKFSRPASDARILAMAHLLNRAYDTVAACRVREENFHHVEIASDLTAAFGELSPDDRARVVLLCPRAAVVLAEMDLVAGITGKGLRELEAAR